MLQPDDGFAVHDVSLMEHPHLARLESDGRMLGPSTSPRRASTLRRLPLADSRAPHDALCPLAVHPHPFRPEDPGTDAHRDRLLRLLLSQGRSRRPHSALPRRFGGMATAPDAGRFRSAEAASRAAHRVFLDSWDRGPRAATFVTARRACRHLVRCFLVTTPCRGRLLLVRPPGCPWATWPDARCHVVGSSASRSKLRSRARGGAASSASS